MITIKVSSDAPKNVVIAVEEANKLLQGKELYERISKRTKPFKFSKPKDLSPSIVSKSLKELDETFTVKMVRFEKPKTTGAYSCQSGKRILKLSNRPNHIDNSIPTIVNTLIHESVHALDCFDSAFYIGHNGNSRLGKSETAPYWIGDQAGKLVDKSDRIFRNVIETDDLQDEPLL